MHARERRRRAERDDVRDGPAVRDRRRRRALEGGRGRAGRPGARAAPTRRRSRSPSSPARRAATRRPTKLHEAVEKAGGQIAAEMNVKAWDLPKWLIEQAKQLEPATLDKRRREGAGRPGRRPPAAAHARAREARARARPGRQRSAPTRSRSPARPRAERKVWTLADALVAGDRKTSHRAPAGAAPAGRARHRPDLQHGRAGCGTRSRSPTRWQPGQSTAQAKKMLRMPPRAADKFVKDVAGARRRGAARARWRRWPTSRSDSRGGELSEDTEAVRAVLIATR